MKLKKSSVKNIHRIKNASAWFTFFCGKSLLNVDTYSAVNLETQMLVELSSSKFQIL